MPSSQQILKQIKDHSKKNNEKYTGWGTVEKLDNDFNPEIHKSSPLKYWYPESAYFYSSPWRTDTNNPMSKPDLFDFRFPTQEEITQKKTRALKIAIQRQDYDISHNSQHFTFDLLSGYQVVSWKKPTRIFVNYFDSKISSMRKTPIHYTIQEILGFENTYVKEKEIVGIHSGNRELLKNDSLIIAQQPDWEDQHYSWEDFVAHLCHQLHKAGITENDYCFIGKALFLRDELTSIKLKFRTNDLVFEKIQTDNLVPFIFPGDFDHWATPDLFQIQF